jgi:hypothetical protein
VEYAAYGIAGLLIWELTDYEVISQSVTGEGVDYWLRKKEVDPQNPFSYAARLEVSGILEGGRNLITNRLNQKLKQTKQSDHSQVPAFVIIVEFSKPEAYVVKR